MTAQDSSSAPVSLSLKDGVLLTLAVTIGIVGWVALGGGVLHLKSLFASFLLVWFWATVEKAEHRRLPSAVAGALLGLALSWVFRTAPALWGNAGMIGAVLLIVVVLFVQIMNWAPFVVNASCMLFLTVGNIPALLASADFLEVGAAVVAGAAFFGLLVWLVKLYAARKAAAPPSAAAHTA
jgi:hypothetical protein